ARAAELSTDPGRAVRRWTAAAEAAIEAGLWQRAGDLVDCAWDRAGSTPLTGAVPAELAYVRARLAVEAGRPLQGVRLLLEGVEAAGGLPMELPLLGMAAYYAWASATHPDQLELARRVEELCPDGEGLPALVRAIVRAFRLILEGDEVTTVVYPAPGSVGHLPPELRFLINFQGLARADIEGMRDDATELVEEYREEGRLGRMPQAMLLLAIAQLLDGQHRSARATVTAGLALASDIGQPMWRGYLAGVHAWLSAVGGAEAECEVMAEQAIRYADPHWWMPGVCWAESARVMRDFGVGRYGAVLERMDRALTGPARHAFLWRYLWPDYIEAAVRVGNPQHAWDRLGRYSEWAEATGRTVQLAVLHRLRALVASGEEAEGLYERALALHAEGRQPFEEARTRLVYGEWLRRHRRRAEARIHLHAALETFDRLGAAPWAARAATELRATGVAVHPPGPGDPLAALTPQELQVVRLAGDGASNREIGAQLFLSPRTVASHLYRAFPKLGISSRAELSKLLD
ncbi:helix-turn-helix transcriptional regulator, partial [Nocardia lijiangensis]|uniref:helix-turn-helix transcriptional regulator n=1 Tax=Nocardia lijiangensis TaxID=299618 RepID=UPI000A599059